MRVFTFLVLLSMLACVSSSRHQTSSYEKLARKHKKIAILPVILEGKNFEENISEEEKRELLEKENNFVQNALYQRILRETGNRKRDVKINIESISVTNNKLKNAGVDILDLSETSDEEIAEILDVDAVLRTNINTTIMLHATKDDFPKEILRTARIFINDPIVHAATNVRIAPVFLNTELIDTKEFIPIWAYSKKRDLRLDVKNNEILEWLTSDTARRFPYRK